MSTIDAYRRTMTEAELQAGLIEAAENAGCLVMHINDSRRQMADGFPDLVIVCHDRLAFFECKNQTRVVEPLQQVWLEALGRRQIAEAAVVRPEPAEDALGYDQALAWIASGAR